MIARSRRLPHPLVTLAGWAAFGLALAAGFQVSGFVLAHLSDLVWGARP